MDVSLPQLMVWLGYLLSFCWVVMLVFFFIILGGIFSERYSTSDFERKNKNY